MREKVATVIFINKNKEILLYLRDDKPTIHYPNMWSLIGGHLEKGENLIQTLKREIKEEIDYDLKKANFLGIMDDKVGNDVYIYKSNIDKKLEELKLTEGQMLNFFNFDNLAELNIPAPLKRFFFGK